MAGPIRIALLMDARQASKTAATFGDKVNNASGKAAVGLGVITAAAVGATMAAENVATANRRVANVLDNMGMSGATDRVIALAEAQEKLTGVDDVAIKAAQAKLATFEAVATTADKVGGAFDRATIASMDLAAAGFGSTESNAVQLGKALQDPIKGISALTRVGVSFTAKEKEKIKTLVESGKASQAQGVILAAVEKQVGGTATATATSSSKIAASFENITESVGGLLLPILEKVTPTIQKVTDLFAANPTVILAIAGAVALFATGILVLNGVLKAIAIAQAAATAAQWLFNTALFASPITWIVLAVAALVAGLIWFFTKTEVGQTIVKGAWEGIKAAIDGVVKWWKDTAWPAIQKVIDWVVQKWEDLSRKVNIAWGLIKFYIDQAIKWVLRNVIIPFIKKVLEINEKFNQVVEFVKGIPGKIKAVFSGAFDWLVNAGQNIIDGFLNGLKRAYENVKSFIGGIGSWIAANKGPKAYDLKLLQKNGGWIMTGLQTGLTNGIPGLKKTLGVVAATVQGTNVGALSASAAGRRLTSAQASVSSGSSAAPVVTLEVVGSTDEFSRFMVGMFKKYIKVNGGNVQRALGATT